MKKITLLLTIMLVSFTSHAQFPENFDGGVIPATWAIFAGDGEAATQQAWAGGAFTSGAGYAICMDENAGFETQDWLVSPLTSIGTANSLLAFNEQTVYQAVYEPAAMSVRVSTTSQTDISSFSSLSSLSATQVFAGTGGVRSVDLSAYEGQDIYIAWVLTQTYGDGWIISDLNLQNQNASAPTPATTPNPEDGATVNLNNATDVGYTFSWSPGVTGDAATAYDFFIGTTVDTDAYTTETTLNDGFTLNGLGAAATTWYWKVVPKNAGGSAVNCPVWSFSTSGTFSTEDNQLSAIVVSPNPVKDVITINSPVGFDSVKVFNQLGQLVIESNSNLINNNRLDLSALNPGMYLVKINADNKSKTVKIIKE